VTFSDQKCKVKAPSFMVINQFFWLPAIFLLRLLTCYPAKRTKERFVENTSIKLSYIAPPWRLTG